MASTPTADVQRIIDFVNTRDVDTGIEHLPDPPHLQAWLAEHGLTPADQPRSAGDVRRAHEVREALRTLLEAHHGAAVDAELAAADAVLTSVPLHLRFADSGQVVLDGRGAGIDAALGRLLAAIPPAVADGTWERTKVCPADSCRWAFYDQSRNRSRRWCSMEVCGNREKSKVFRARHTAAD